MADYQVSLYETLGQRPSSEDVELTNFLSHDSRMRNDHHFGLPDQRESTASSTESLHQSPDSEYSQLARPHPLQQSEDTQYSGVTAEIKCRSAVQRMGTYSVIVLAGSTILVLAVVSFLTFLWTAPRENSFWRLIIIKGWAGSAVTVSALLLRTAVDLQAGVAAAMLAAIVIETGHIFSIDTAQVSRLRAGRAVPTDIVAPFIRSIRHEWPRSLSGLLTVLVVLLLVATTMLHQFTSTMLISDLALGIQPGAPRAEDLRYDFTYEHDKRLKEWTHPSQSRASRPWLRNPSAFPTFAEFSEPVDVPEHVDDTGRIFRAFLPFQDAQSRETISHYIGKCLVLDARVSCQRPQLQNLHVEYSNDGNSYVGTFSKTEDNPELLGSASSVPFNCQTPADFNTYNGLIICQPSGLRYGDGKLLSELRGSDQWSPIAERWKNKSLLIDERPNAAYLIFNNTASDPSENVGNSTRNIPAVSGHGSWTDVSYLPLADGTSLSPRYWQNISVTLCYPANWAARLSVTIHSPHNRTEPSASSFEGSFRTTPDIHAQMGEFKHDHKKAYAFDTVAIGVVLQLIKRSTLESRGVLSLVSKDSWLPDPGDAAQYDYYDSPRGRYSVVQNSFIAESSEFATYLRWNHTTINSSLLWALDRHGRVTDIGPADLDMTTDRGSPDITLASIFTTSLQVTNGSAATALSTIITVLASMAYYDQFPNFAETAHNVSTTYFEPFLFPQSFRGFSAVLIITVVHYFLVALIVATFLTFTSLSTLGDHWQTISQIISPATEEILKKNSCATDKEVRQGLKAEHRELEMAILQVLPSGDGRVGLVAWKPHRRSSHDMDMD